MREGTIVKRVARWILLLTCLSVGLSTAAQQAVSVLDIEPGAGLLGAGGAGIAVVYGAETLYYNPAGLAELPGISFSSFYASHMGLANYSAFALTFRNIGIGAMLFGSGGVFGYDERGTQTGTLSYRNSAFLVGFGLDPSTFQFFPEMAFDFALGGQVKLLSTSVGETDGSGFAFDLGFRTTFPALRLGPLDLSDAALGVTVVNVFGGLNYPDTQENFRMDIRVGVASRFEDVVLVAIDLHLGGAAHVGVSYWPVSTLALRLGAILKGPISVTGGVGLNIEGFLIDYAYMSHPLGGSHRVSLCLDFSALDIGALGRSLGRLLR
jgi:hypothetical protein